MTDILLERVSVFFVVPRVFGGGAPDLCTRVRATSPADGSWREEINEFGYIGMAECYNLKTLGLMI